LLSMRVFSTAVYFYIFASHRTGIFPSTQ
jgi:hypothetical protein